MTWILIGLVVLAVVVAAALAWTAMKRKKQQVARERAGELRSEAVGTTATTASQEARAREAQAQADVARARADELELQAREEQTSLDMTRATQEDRVREADRLDPEVDHRDPDYHPKVPSQPGGSREHDDARHPRESDHARRDQV